MLNISGINSKFHTIYFKQNAENIEPVKNTMYRKQDSFDKAEPPILKDYDIASGKFTDEQIAQINKAKRLPDNAKFYPIHVQQGRYGARKTDKYMISLSSFDDKIREIAKKAHIKIKDEGIRELPEGYEVVRLKGFWVNTIAAKKSEINQSVLEI